MHSISSASLGLLLRDLRAARRLTQTQAARASGLGRVTLVRWETGAQRPRVPELNALLDALGAESALRNQALALLGTPHALAAVQRQENQMGFGPAPGGADLLRAMRRRRGLPLDAAAAAAGVRPWTLRRWEAGEAWPDPNRLQALCAALGAHPAEAAALASGPVLPGSSAPTGKNVRGKNVWGEDFRERLAALHRRICAGGSALTTLECLSLQAEAWLQAPRSDDGRFLLAHSYYLHAMHANFRQDARECARLARQAVEVWPDHDLESVGWFYCSILAASPAAGDTPTGNARAYRRLILLQEHLAEGDGAARWASPAAKNWGEMAAWISARAADCLAGMENWDEAVSLSRASCRIAAARSDLAEERRRFNGLASLLLEAGRPAEARAVLEGLGPDNSMDTVVYNQVDLALARVEAYLGTDSPAQALNWLGEANRVIQLYDLPGYQGRVETLAWQF